MKQLPYGISDFRRIRRDDMYYVDKTKFIPLLEDEFSYLSLLRPRKFGKSLLVSMLEAYYDCNAKDQFQSLFGDLYIGKHPTSLANSYQVLRFDFSRAGGQIEQLENQFNAYCCKVLDSFILKYKDQYDDYTLNTIIESHSAEDKLNTLVLSAERFGNRIYLLIDEYDNFTNDVLAHHGKEAMHDLLHAEGFYRRFFKLFKGPIERIFITGISPVTLDDLTSGYNIDWDISDKSYFNAIVGFEESEVKDLLQYYKENQGILASMNVDSIIEDMRPWYDNYCFSVPCYGHQTLFNCDMILYYMKPMLKTGRPPMDMVDKNIKTDYSKLKQLVNLDRNLYTKDRLSDIERIANEGYIDMRLKRSFRALELLDRSNFRSLIYYYGMLTIGGGDEGYQHMIVPNECVMQQYWHFLVNTYDDIYPINISELADMYLDMIYRGEWKKAINQIGELYYQLSSVRDSRGGEFNQHGFFKAMLGLCDVTVLCPELELNYGYGDFLMLPLRHHYPNAIHAYIFELKYVSPEAKEEEVKSQLSDAEQQIHKYASSKRLLKSISGCTLHGITILFRGPIMDPPIQVLELTL